MSQIEWVLKVAGFGSHQGCGNTDPDQKPDICQNNHRFINENTDEKQEMDGHRRCHGLVVP